jgi:hypothetical protein
VPTEIEGGVRREAGDQNGQSDEIWIVCSGNDHRDRANSDQRLTGDESADLPANAADNVIEASLKADVGRQRPMLADVPQMTWFANVKMLLWRFVDKMDGE